MPVLSITRAVSRHADSSASPFTTSMPSLRALPMAATRARGMAIPSAHGQAITRTVIILTRAASRGFPEVAREPVAPVEETVSLTLEVEEPKVDSEEIEALMEPVNVTPLVQPEPVREPEEQFLFTAEELERPRPAASAVAPEPEEDWGIPAFMRRRMKRQ